MPDSMKQMTLKTRGFEKYGKVTRLARFLADMNRAVPWAALYALIEPFYRKGMPGRPLVCAPAPNKTWT